MWTCLTQMMKVMKQTTIQPMEYAKLEHKLSTLNKTNRKSENGRQQARNIMNPYLMEMYTSNMKITQFSIND
jgi:hypothetical protein